MQKWSILPTNKHGHKVKAVKLTALPVTFAEACFDLLANITAKRIGKVFQRSHAIGLLSNLGNHREIYVKVQAVEVSDMGDMGNFLGLHLVCPN